VNVVQSNKEQAVSSRTSLITVTKDTQTTVAGNTDAPRVKR